MSFCLSIFQILQGEDLNANEGSVTIVSNNPIANLSSSSSSTIEINNSNDNGAESIHEVLNLRCDSEDCTVQALTNHKDAEFEKFGFIHRGITRNLPLQSKGSDPCECLDIYDDMYGFFVENEVILNFLFQLVYDLLINIFI